MVFTEMCFILEEYLKCAFGVLVEANFWCSLLHWCCWFEFQISFFALLWLYFILCLRGHSQPPCCHTQIHFQGWSQQQNPNNKSQASPKKPPPQHSVLHSSGLWSLNHRCSCWAPAAHKSHTSTSRVWLSGIMESVKGYGTSSVTVPAWKWFRWTEMQQVQLWGEFRHEQPAKASSASTHDQIRPGTLWWCQALPRW